MFGTTNAASGSTKAVVETVKDILGTSQRYTCVQLPEAIRECYKKGFRDSAEANYIYYLGEGTSFDIKGLFPTQYMNFKEDNFICEPLNSGVAGHYGGDNDQWRHRVVTGKNYNANAGVLTVSCYLQNQANYDNEGWWRGFENALNVPLKVYVASAVRAAGEANYIYDLGVGTSFDIKKLFPDEYQQWTKDNFVVEIPGFTGSGEAWNRDQEGRGYSTPTMATFGTSSSVSKSYSNGVLTIGGLSNGGGGENKGSNMWTGGSMHVNMNTPHVYLVSNVRPRPQIYYLGSGTSFDIKSKLPNDYMNLTNDNFIVNASFNGFRQMVGQTGSQYGNVQLDGASFSPNYNPLTGALTVNNTINGRYAVTDGGGGLANDSWHGTSASATIRVYVVIGEILSF